MTKDQIQALSVAVNVLNGEGGEYSPAEKEKAAELLNKMFADGVAEWERENSAPDQGVKQ